MRALAAVTAAALALGCEDGSRRAFSPPDAATVDAADAGESDAPTGIGLGCSDEREMVEAVAGCRGGQRCYTSARGFPGGYCTQDCLLRPCPGDSYCLSEGSTRYCVRRCSDDAECRGAEGYVCVRPSPTLPRGCLPDPAPTGSADGGACASGDALPRGSFTGDGESASRERPDSDTEAEPSLALSPVDGTVTVSYIGRDPGTNLVSGLSRRRADGSWAMDGVLTDREFNNTINPVIAYDRAGALWASYLALTFDRPSPSVRVSRSTDHGVHWEDGRSITPLGRCAGGCDPPWLAIGAAPGNPARDRFHVVYLTRSTRRDAWVTAQHSDDGGAHWSDPSNLDGVGLVGRIDVEPTAPTVAVDAAGAPHVAWVIQSRANTRSALGDTHNVVRYASDRDGAGPSEAPVAVSGEGESVVAQPPQVAVVCGSVHVLYVAGTPDGRWNIRLASRAAVHLAGAHRERRRPCATHGFAALAGATPRGRRCISSGSTTGTATAMWPLRALPPRTRRSRADPTSGCRG
nr:exo-alpha-sialidase [Deltaproteobacteria bacterium]